MSRKRCCWTRKTRRIVTAIEGVCSSSSFCCCFCRGCGCDPHASSSACCACAVCDRAIRFDCDFDFDCHAAVDRAIAISMSSWSAGSDAIAASRRRPPDSEAPHASPPPRGRS